jgi:hypothetical protein
MWMREDRYRFHQAAIARFKTVSTTEILESRPRSNSSGPTL